MNKEQEITELSRKFLSGFLSPDEMKRMKELITQPDGSISDNHLQWLWNNYSNKEERNKKAYTEVAGNLKTMLHSESQPRIGIYIWRGVAAVFLPILFLTSAYLLFERQSVKSSIGKEHTLLTDKGERASVVLPDGTKVYLNSQTELSYPASFALSQRKIKLTGEAYFEVSHDEKRPFTVQASGLEVKVLGTTFNLYAQPDDDWFEASLIEGKVEITVAHSSDKKIILTPGQKVRYNTVTGETKVVDTDLRMETAWRRGDLIFRSEQLHVILKELESFYGARINILGEIPKELFTGSYHEDDIMQVLLNLQQHYHFSFDKIGNNIRIKFKKNI